MNGLAKQVAVTAVANDSDQPHSTYTMPTTPIATYDIIIMFSTDLERVMPP